MTTSGKKVAIVLASGVSRRFGLNNKLMTPIGDLCIIEKTIDNLKRSNIDDIIVVTGYQRSVVERILQNDIKIFAHNPDYASGIGTSIHAGILALPRDAGAALIVLGDMPYVPPKAINLLLTAFENKNDKLIFIPTFKGKKGNPVLWDKTLFPDLLNLGPDQGGKIIFSEKPGLIKEVNVGNDGILRDIDFPEDIKH